MVNALSERRTACYRRTGVIVSLCKASDLSHFARLHVVKLCPGVPVSKKTCMQQNILRCSKIALRCSSDRRNLHCHKALSPMGLLRGVIDSVSAKLAFFPPSPPSYEVPAFRSNAYGDFHVLLLNAFVGSAALRDQLHCRSKVMMIARMSCISLLCFRTCTPLLTTELCFRCQ